ncbi:MAG: hypothetical protein DRJ66_03265 [Thermoprotei archaeon]|nr:MAG: hypothetical protein DRJ66_03265 [Thermoprotei archaeon]
MHRDSKERKEDEELLKAYQVLAHPVRRGIIKFLGEKGKAGFTELQKHLKASTGTLYYNLEQLNGFVTQDRSRKYMLTEKGRGLYEILVKDEERIKAYLNSGGFYHSAKLRNALRPVSIIFLPQWLRVYLLNETYCLFLSLSSLVISLLSINIGRLKFSLFFFTGSSNNPVILVLHYMLSWLFIYCLLELFSFIFHGIPKEHLKLFITVPLGLLPLLIYPIIYKLCLQYMLKEFVIGASLVILQAMTLGYLTVILSSIKKMKYEYAFIAVSLTYYVCLMFNIMITPEFLQSFLRS